MNKPIDFVSADPYLLPYLPQIKARRDLAVSRIFQLSGSDSLKDFACGYLYFGMHKDQENRIFREWAPDAVAMYLIGDFSDWKPAASFAFIKLGNSGNWELKVPLDKLVHGMLYKLLIRWKGGEGERIPAWARRTVQDEKTHLFSAQIWDPEPYEWKISTFTPPEQAPLVYEAHVGMATEEYRVGTFREFSRDMIPRIAALGYNTLQLMAVQEHPYYGSFGYHVSSFYAVSSRFGTPEDFKALVDTAHAYGLRVVMDLIHSHAVKNVLEGLNVYAGNPGQFFHKGPRRNHPAWDSLCFDYGKPEVIHFLLSNCKFWMEEYKIDGFRFDGVTSMLYTHHGLNRNFTGYAMYFDGSEDPDAITYLMMANRLIHEIRPDALTIAEEMSGMPGIATPFEALGFGFDYRLAMGIPDYWIKLIKEVPDETWDVGNLYYELTRKREDEKTIGYSESHDQALVGDQTLIFRLIGSDMYDGMRITDRSLTVDRGIALHKLIKLMTLSTAGNGYLNFMGNEFGHPEWIDFPREGNDWSYQYARRQWSLVEDPSLRFYQLRDFDRMLMEKIGQAEHFYDEAPVLIHDNKPEQVLAFKRSGLLFVFNLNPQKSFTRYEIETGAGKYKIVLSTDDAEFGGFDRIDRTMTYFTTSPVPNKRMINTSLSLYLPSRCGIVLREEKTRGIYTLLSGDERSE